VEYLIVGCGYVGLRVAAAWARSGHRVAALTRSEDNARRFSALGITPIVGDVLDRSSLSALPTAGTVLYGVGFDRDSGNSLRDVYVDGLRNVLDALGTRSERLIYLSSISVYGQTAGEWVDETSPCEPSSPNGQACLEAEQILKNQQGDRANILRLAGIYGPGRLLARLAALREGEQLAGNPDGFLNLIHVEDIVRAVLACESHGKPGETYLVSDDRPVARREYYETLARLIDAPPPQFSGTDSRRHPYGSLNKQCRNQRMRRELSVDLAYPTVETGLSAALAGE
jgi:nucleoside-diphosphate-sugar epimerase